jgi:Ca-activated chloride channel homolog
LYSGAPVRVYGRYRGSGTAQVALRASVNGKEAKQTASLEFPKTDISNPEIDRIWAWRRVNRLLKDAERQGDRSPVINEIVRLGEDFSIATEYTSFIVLENDAEYQRWKIARKNLETFGRDQVAHAKRREQLDAIRNKALADLGPQPASAAATSTPQQFASNIAPAPQLNPSRTGPGPTQTQPQPPRRQSSDMNIGTGPVGPLGLLVVMWFLRRKQRAA